MLGFYLFIYFVSTEILYRPTLISYINTLKPGILRKG